jgi:cytochrome c553
MLDFKNKQRNNAQPMNALFGTFADEEIKAVSQYLAGFKE